MNKEISRRRTLSLLSAAIAGLWSAAVAVVAGAFVTTPLRGERRTEEFSLGKLISFDGNFRLVQLKVPIEDGWHSREEHIRLYARMSKSGVAEVISATCTHLSCTVRWNSGVGEFQCPCHGGRFAADVKILRMI